MRPDRGVRTFFWLHARLFGINFKIYRKTSWPVRKSKNGIVKSEETQFWKYRLGFRLSVFLFFPLSLVKFSCKKTVYKSVSPCTRRVIAKATALELFRVHYYFQIDAILIGSSSKLDLSHSQTEYKYAFIV